MGKKWNALFQPIQALPLALGVLALAPAQTPAREIREDSTFQEGIAIEETSIQPSLESHIVETSFVQSP